MLWYDIDIALLISLTWTLFTYVLTKGLMTHQSYLITQLIRVYLVTYKTHYNFVTRLDAPLNIRRINVRIKTSGDSIFGHAARPGRASDMTRRPRCSSEADDNGIH